MSGRDAGAPWASSSHSELVVLDAGPSTTVQDLGRPGLAHLGVPRSGAVDQAAARYANRLVGNPEGAAVLETTFGGVRVGVSGRAVTVAVTGAPAPLWSGGRPRGQAEPFLLRPGEELAMGVPTSGVRGYLAVAGGIDCPAVLGSRSTDTLSGLGPAPLSAGGRLPLGEPGTPRGHAAVALVHAFPGSARLRVVPGPRLDWFEPEALDVLTGADYVVSPDSNRVGMRLAGPALSRSSDKELPSEGLVLGAVQVPSSGQPVVFLHDHPTTGGYPVIAVVHPASIPGCAQLPPGSTVRFVL